MYDPIVEYATLDGIPPSTSSPPPPGWFTSSRRAATHAGAAVMDNLLFSMRRPAGRSASVSGAPPSLPPSDADYETISASEVVAASLEAAAAGKGGSGSAPISVPGRSGHEDGKMSTSLPESPSMHALASPIGKLQRVASVFMPMLSGKSRIFDEGNMAAYVGAIMKKLPGRFSLANWKLIYSTAVHGISMHTLYANVFHYGHPAIFVFKDAKGAVRKGENGGANWGANWNFVVDSGRIRYSVVVEGCVCCKLVSVCGYCVYFLICLLHDMCSLQYA